MFNRLSPIFASLVFASSLFGCGGSDAAHLGYAERTYDTFASASSGDVKISVATLSSGPMSELAGRRLQDLLAVGTKVLRSRAAGAKIVSSEIVERGDDSDFFSDGLVDNFENDGHPLAQGSYRMLAVTLKVGAQEVQYRALEASWPEFSILADPVIQQVDAFAQNQNQLKAAAGQPEIVATHLPELSTNRLMSTPNTGVVTAAGKVCALSSHHNWGGESITWPGYAVYYNNIYGGHLVTFNIGGQQAGISCTISGSSCVPTSFGYSNRSSCSAILGYSCICQTTGIAVGQTGNRMAVATQTECDYKNPLTGSAKLTYSKNGVGAEMNISWDNHGAAAEEFNGGELVDTCAWF